MARRDHIILFGGGRMGAALLRVWLPDDQRARLIEPRVTATTARARELAG
jgi:pyrroline-5-carboxylate reductase